MPARTTRTPYALLGALTQGPMTGYELRASLDGSVGHFWHEGFGQIYPALARLAAGGLVRVHDEPGTSGPPRRVHELTDAGRAALVAWLERPVESEQPTRSELLLKVFFAANVAPAVTARHLADRRAALVALLERYRTLEAAIAADPSPEQRYWLATVRHGVHLARAGIAWCDETADALGTDPDDAAGTAAQEAP